MIQMKQSFSPNFVYLDSSEDQIEFFDNQSDKQQSDIQLWRNQQKQFAKGYGKNFKDCQMSPDQYLLNDKYLDSIEEIIKENMQKLQKKAPLLIPNNDVEILQNIQKRNLKYKHFLKQLEIDKKYRKILEQKTKKLNQQNQRKKNILQKNKIREKLIEQQTQLQKYVIDKKSKQLQITAKIQKFVHKVGIQKIRDVQKVTKQKIKNNRNQVHEKLINLQNKQKNQLDQLRQQLQSIKESKRVNGLEQRKVIKDLAKRNQEQKKNLIVKCSSNKVFKI